MNVINVSKTAPRSISANSPTNTVPHVTWQPPVSFLVGAWNIYRDGALLTTLGDASASSFDDTALAAQGPHTYAVQAVNDTQTGDISSPVSVTFDTMAPAADPASATANPDGSISWNGRTRSIRRRGRGSRNTWFSGRGLVAAVGSERGDDRLHADSPG